MNPLDKTGNICEGLTREQAEAYGLLLTAIGLPYSTRKSNQGWEIWVDPSRRIEALDLIRQYDLENKSHQPIDSAPDVHIEQKTLSAIWVALFLLIIHLITTRPEFSRPLFRTYSSAAQKILNGEIYRVFTSLMLHADLSHLAGNIAGIAIFGTALCRTTGAGFGWLIILLCGALGNMANAAFIQRGHDSIGASTAVFGALGFLAAYQFYRKITAGNRRVKAWLPLAGGLALLGFLGSGVHTDLTAHLFGFAAGICLGLAYPRYLSCFQGKKCQMLSAAAAISLVGLSGIWPLVF